MAKILTDEIIPELKEKVQSSLRSETVYMTSAKYKFTPLHFGGKNYYDKCSCIAYGCTNDGSKDPLVVVFNVRERNNSYVHNYKVLSGDSTLVTIVNGAIVFQLGFYSTLTVQTPYELNYSLSASD